MAQMTSAGLVDEYQVIVNPVVLGRGRAMFEGVEGRPALSLVETRAFENGNVLLSYRPLTRPIARPAKKGAVRRRRS